MGRLRRLELDNFKSYAGNDNTTTINTTITNTTTNIILGLQVVGPFDDFTCIIGPNGAGKSNMMDAISFVLGVQSRHLRSSSLKDLIFRKDSSSLPARKASVKLFYEVSKDEVDNYNEGSEIEFCRTITSSGVSTYRLNNKETTYEIYEETLQQIGILILLLITSITSLLQPLLQPLLLPPPLLPLLLAYYYYHYYYNNYH